MIRADAHPPASALQLVKRDRQIADALSRRVMDRVGDGSGDADDADFAEPLDAERIVVVRPWSISVS
jgi:hypothetical protein